MIQLKIHRFPAIVLTLCCLSWFLMCKGPQQAVDASGLVLHSLSDTLDQGGFADTSEIADEDYFEKEYVRMENHVYQPNVKTILLHQRDWPLSTPVIELHTHQQLMLSFDDLNADVEDYYYTVLHCNMDWTVSDLSPTDYINGFIENDISDYSFSFNTMEEYTHYMVVFPNDDLQLNYSGNYVVKVYLEGQADQPVITMRFMVVEPLVKVVPQVKHATLIADRNYKQEVDFTIHYEGYDILDPFGEVGVVITQNNRWDNSISGLQPTFVRDNELIYDYDEDNVFLAGSEFRNADFKSFRYKTEEIREFGTDSTGNHVYLLPDEKRSFRRYFSRADINGRFFIKNEDNADDSSIEADYAHVHFTLPFEAPLIDGNLYVLGSLTHGNITQEGKMKYNYEKFCYEATLYLKQGYYEYQYAYLEDGQKSGNLAFIEGSHYETENDYSIYIYNTSLRNNYHQLIAVKNFGSRN